MCDHKEIQIPFLAVGAESIDDGQSTLRRQPFDFLQIQVVDVAHRRRALVPGQQRIAWLHIRFCLLYTSYAKAAVWFVNKIQQVRGVRTPISELLFLGDTLFNDGQAFTLSLIHI